MNKALFLCMILVFPLVVTAMQQSSTSSVPTPQELLVELTYRAPVAVSCSLAVDNLAFLLSPEKAADAAQQMERMVAQITHPKTALLLGQALADYRNECVSFLSPELTPTEAIKQKLLDHLNYLTMDKREMSELKQEYLIKMSVTKGIYGDTVKQGLQGDYKVMLQRTQDLERRVMATQVALSLTKLIELDEELKTLDKVSK